MVTPVERVELEIVERCDLCGSTESTPLFESRDRLHRLPGSFGIVRCDGCGCVRLSPRPTKEHLARYYPGEDYLPHRPGGFTQGDASRTMGGVRDAVRDEVLRKLGYPKPQHRWVRPFTTLAHRPLLRRVAFGWQGFPPFVPNGRALDIGSGNGFFLALLRHHGWEVQGLDLSESAAETTRRVFGIDVHVCEVTDESYRPGQFDFVHMSHVIEHVDSPTATLARVAELVKPGGLLYIETPNVASLGARIWGPRWFALDSPRHLWLFTPDTLVRALEVAGFRVNRFATLVWKDLIWEGTYQWEERMLQERSPRPSVDLHVRPKLLALSGLTRTWHMVARRSGDILSCWAKRPE